MPIYIRTKDAQAYFLSQQLKNNKILDAEKVRYNNARVKYESGKWFKFFKTPFYQTGKGNLGWLHTNWYEYIYAMERETAIDNALAQIEYYIKTEVKEIEWTFDGYSHEKFFQYCRENNIPY